MQNYLFPLVAFIVILSSNTKAADDKYLFAIEQALNKHSTLVDPNIELYFATLSAPCFQVFGQNCLFLTMPAHLNYLHRYPGH